MDIPVVNMIVRAGIVAKIVLFVLLIFSIVSWAVVIGRFRYLGWARKMHNRFRERFTGIAKLTDIEAFDPAIIGSPLGQVGKAGSVEYKRILNDAQTHTGVKDWSFFLESQFQMAKEKLEAEFGVGSRKLDRSVFVLALISSCAPFVGLLGTVWGIMDSFFEIGQQGSASLPVVAPGIAEALIATAIALAVAIPAVFFYNYFNHQVERIEDDMDDQKDGVLLKMKRDILSLLYSSAPRIGQSAGVTAK
jgi:biopolymer transport protein TolQ